MRFFTIIVSLLVAIGLYAQELTINQQLEDFDLTVQTVEANYAGFTSKVTVQTDSCYRSMKAALRTQVEAGERGGAEAAAEYVGWFADMHLFLAKEGYNMSQQYMPESKQLTDHKVMEYSPAKTACKVTDKTFLIRFPSCQGNDPDMEWIEQSVQSYLQSGCDHLILDIRGNGGGQDQFYKPYLGLLYDHPGLIDGVEFYNSPGNMESLLQRVESMGNAPEFLTSFAEQLRASADYSFVQFVDTYTLVYDTVYQHPTKAAIIIDKYVASSGEQMLLEVRATSRRTTIYGRDNSMGCIDFSNVRPAATLPWSKAILGVPMTRSLRVPDRGVDETGISPDVRITLPLPESLTDKIDSWVIWVADDLEKQQ